MQRRKFVIGLGSLAAGASAVVGTGAITETSMERGVRGRVAADGPNSAYVAINPLLNGEHLEFNQSTGEMRLFFGDLGSGGAGLNPDSNNRFDAIFEVENQNPGGNSVHEFWLWIENSHPRLTFYLDSQPGNSIEGISNAESMGSGNDDPVRAPVGVHIDLTDSGLTAGDNLQSLFDPNDEFVIHMEKTNGSPP
jgi:hypothetical protein